MFFGGGARESRVWLGKTREHGVAVCAAQRSESRRIICSPARSENKKGLTKELNYGTLT
jgi:hypothetical protein